MKNLIATALILCWALAAAAQFAEPTTADEIMAKVFVRDRERERLSQGYTGRRLYVLDNEKWHKHSELLVAVNGEPDGSKHFEILNEEGWKSANKRVLKKMLESETDTSRPTMRRKTLLTRENYSFSLLQTDFIDGRLTYVIGVTAKRNDKYLFDGQIWVDGSDFALVRCEGKPARTPSFWTRGIHFMHQYQKTSDFWFPNTTESITDARIFGKTSVVIHYLYYSPNSAPMHDAGTPHNLTFQKANYASNH